MQDTELTFNASCSLSNWIMSAVVIALLLGIPLFVLMSPPPGAKPIELIIISAICIVPIPLVGLYAPLSFRVDRSGVTVQRLGPKVRIAAHNIDKVDRISRNLFDLLKLIENLRSWGVDFVTASQEIDTSTPAGTLTLNML